MVSEFDSAFDRGCIPAHLVREMMETRLTLLLDKACDSSHRYLMVELGLFPQQTTAHIAVSTFNQMICEHNMSYHKFSRPYVNYQLPPVVTPDAQFSKYIYFQTSGFWPEQCQEISNELTLIPDAQMVT